MTDILAADYMSESTEDLIRRAEQILSDPRLYPKADDIIPYSRSGFGFMEQSYPTNPRLYPKVDDIIPYSRSGFGFMTQQIRTLSPSCNRIEVKNVITVTDSSIVICAGAATGTCPGIPPSCPVGVTPNDYVNMIATVTALVAQTGVTIRFEYLLDDSPTTTDVVVDLVAGLNTVYAFAVNQQYIADTTLALFGARVL